MKPYLSRFIIAFLFLIAFSHDSISQTVSSTREKVHLHTDKPFYAAGDTIWFKAYAVTAGDNIPSTLSRVLYVDLFNPQGKLQSALRLLLQGGLSHGDIILPDTLKEGGYRLRAYTTTMRAFGPEAFFDKEIRLINGFEAAGKRSSSAAAPIAQLPDVQFFPEGGDLVAGLRSKVGIKITGKNGFGLPATGEVVDEANKTIAYLNTAYAGIGTFAVTPVPGQKYFALLKFPDGSTQKVPLPDSKPAGYMLTVNNAEKDSVIINIAQSATQGNAMLVLTARNETDEYFSARIVAKGTRSVVKIPRKVMPEGVIRLTLSTAQNEPVAERLIFNDNNEALRMKINVAKGNNPDEVQVQLQVNDSQNNPVQGSFSMAVVSSEDVLYNEDDDLSIRANLLLKSDLKGFIEHPNHYFNAQNHTDSLERARQLDNLLLTQGWRRFVWQTQAGKDNSDEGLKVSGRLLNGKGTPIAGSKVRLFATVDAMPMLLDTITDAAGRFLFKDLDFYGPVKFALQTKDVKNRQTLKVLFDTMAIAAPPAVTPVLSDSLEIARQETSMKRFDDLSKAGMPRKAIALKEVKIQAKKAVPSTSGISRNFANKVISGDKFKYAPDILSVIEMNYRDIKFDNEGNAGYYGIRESRAKKAMRDKNTSQGNAFALIVDGNLTPVSFSWLSGVSASDVESVEVYLDGSVVGIIDKGVIVINTKRGNKNVDYSKEKVPGMNTILVNGYSKAREFYVPKYTIQQTKPDLRDVIYWNPEIVTDNSGKAIMNYYRGDKSKRYRIIIEGITQEGETGRLVVN